MQLSFIQWNLPYAALAASMDRLIYARAATPECLTIASPQVELPPDHRTEPLSPMPLVHKKAAQDRSNLFLQGRMSELFVRCSEDDKMWVINTTS